MNPHPTPLPHSAGEGGNEPPPIRVGRLATLAFLVLACTVLSAGNCSQDRVKSMEANNAGVEQFKRKLYPDAIRELQRAIAIDGTNEEAFHNLALVYMETENWRAAAQNLSRAISLSPSKARYHYELGTVQQELTEFAEAEQSFKKAIELEPSLFKAHHRLGQVLEEQDKAQEALQAYTTAVEKNPRYLPAYSRLGTLYADLSFLDQAVQVFQSALQVAPEGTEERADIHQRLGTVYQEQHKYDEAIAEFRHALDIVPSMTDALFSLGWTYGLQNNKENAKLYLKKFVDTAGSRARADYIKAATDRLLEMEETVQ